MTATAAGVTTTITYDPLGRLFEVVKGSADSRFIYDGDALVAEYNSAGTLTSRYVHGSSAADDPLVWYTSSALSSKRYLHADHLGSIVAVTNSSSAPSINKYDDYGIPQMDANNVNTNAGRFQYTGQAFIPELGAGMYYYKARMYSAFLGRFLQTDPVGYEDQISLYEYVGDDPINRSDPSGLLGCGPDLKGPACDKFKADQAAAAEQLTAAIKTVRSLASDLAAGKKLSGAERATQAAINKYQGPGTGSDVKFLGKFAVAGDRIVSALISNFPVEPHSQVGTSLATTPVGVVKMGPVYIYPNYYNQSDRIRQETWPHEGAHFSLGARDYVYGSADAARLARDNPSAAQDSADNIALAFGFQRDN